MKIYPSDLSDLVWEKIEVVFKVDYSRGGRPPKHSKQEILNGIFYVAKTACQWRFLPTTYPPWKTVYTYFKNWKKTDVFERLNHRLRKSVRLLAGKNISMSIHLDSC